MLLSELGRFKKREWRICAHRPSQAHELRFECHLWMKYDMSRFKPVGVLYPTAEPILGPRRGLNGHDWQWFRAGWWRGNFFPLSCFNIKKVLMVQETESEMNSHGVEAVTLLSPLTAARHNNSFVFKISICFIRCAFLITSHPIVIFVCNKTA